MLWGKHPGLLQSVATSHLCGCTIVAVGVRMRTSGQPRPPLLVTLNSDSLQERPPCQTADPLNDPGALHLSLRPDAKSAPVLATIQWCHEIWDTKRLILLPALKNVFPVRRWASSACAAPPPPPKP